MLLAVVWPTLLPASLLVLSIPAVMLLRRYPVLIGFILGLTAWHGQGYRQIHPQHPLLQTQGTETQELIATVVGLPSGEQIYQRTLWQVEAINGEKLLIFWGDLVRLSWYQPLDLKQGQRFWLNVKLNPPAGVLNQGGGNQRRALLAKGIVATGYIKEAKRLDDTLHWRQKLADRLEHLTQGLARGDLIRALALGDRRGLNEARWLGLKASGLVHLVAISGLHLTIVALWLLALGRWLLPRIWPSPRGRGISLLWLLCGFIVLCYSALAGNSLPTQRAMLMVLFGLVLLWRRQESQPWEILLFTAALVLFINPLAALGAGFWLSFGAVTSLLLLNWWRPLSLDVGSRPYCWRAQIQHFIYLQIGLAVVMPVIQGLTLNIYTLQAFWANLLILPLFSFVILPVCLLSTALALSLDWPAPLLLADWALMGVTLGNKLAFVWQQHWPWLGGYLTLSQIINIIIVLSIALLLWLKPWRGWHWQAGLLALPLFLKPFYPTKHWQLHLVDVGQGLAAVVEQQGQFLLYDTGAAFNGYSYAQRAVLPMLRERGAERLDYFVLSHGDNDHAGGAEFITDAFFVKQRRGWQGRCSGTEQWGKLTLNWWRASKRGKGNNHSCTLLISDGKNSVLLPGDIEQSAEAKMLNANQVKPVTLLVAPHHGSSSSSSPAWLAKLQPQWVLIPAGWNNRWGFPHPHVLARYQAIGSQVKVVGEQGQISVHFSSHGPLKIKTQRQNRTPWWYNQQQH